MQNDTAYIETFRCGLRLLQREDRNDLAALYRNHEVRRYLGGVVNEQNFAHRFEQMLDHLESKNWVVRLKQPQNLFVGLVTLAWSHDKQDLEISYQFMPSFWTQGLARETLSALIDHATSVSGWTQLIAETQAANLRSRRLLEHLGMSSLRTLTRFGEEQIIYRRAVDKATSLTNP